METKKLGGYELRDVLGEGGMGVVYRGHDPTLDRPAAVKVIRRQTLTDEGKQRFLHEARACSRINHPNIITVYAAGEENGTPYMAMELIDGRTLRDVIREGPIEWRTATKWVAQLLDALQRLHAEGIVHRDLKPENIMVTKEGVIRLMDFGLAHLASMTAITQEGTTLGTVPYMSPEQVMGKKLDARSDLFSLATIYQEMLTGAHPFAGEHPMAIMYAIRAEQPKAIEIAAPDFPAGIRRVLERAFQKEPEGRFTDAAAFRDAILAEAPDLMGGTIVEVRASPVRMALIVAGVATVVVAGGLFGWNAFQESRAAANRTAAKNLNEQGQLRMQANDLVGAEEFFRQAIAKDESYAVAYNNLGMLALNAGNRPEADSLFHDAVERDPRNSAALINIGDLFYDALPESAEAYYRRATLGDEPAPAANQLGFLLLEQKRLDEAKEVLDRALAANPPAAVKGFLLRNRARVAAAAGDSTAADRYMREAAPLLPADAQP
jgi:tetratricopeptide (TPR) repeat protein/predicted Ser/Thr protein kinase